MFFKYHSLIVVINIYTLIFECWTCQCILLNLLDLIFLIYGWFSVFCILLLAYYDSFSFFPLFISLIPLSPYQIVCRTSHIVFNRNNKYLIFLFQEENFQHFTICITFTVVFCRYLLAA